MSSTGSLRMYTEMSYIFDAEYTRLIDHLNTMNLKQFTLDDIHTRTHPCMHNSAYENNVNREINI